MNQQQSNRRGHFWSIILALIIGLIGTFWSLKHSRTEQPEQPALPQVGQGLTVYFLPAGEGQCVLLTCEGDSLLLDAGPETFGQTAADLLRSQKVKRLDLLISSRVEDDYSGGLATIVQNFPVKTVWNTHAHRSQMTAGEEAFESALRAAGIDFSIPKDGETFSLGSAELRAVMTDADGFRLEFTYGETEGAVGRGADSFQPKSDTEVTAYVSDGAQIVCVTDSPSER